jgi:hypothetical protein
MGVRKNQKDMTNVEWTAFIAAIDAMHGSRATAPAYRRFITLHVDAMKMSHMDWSVHTMRMMDGSFMRGRNFFAWHRRLVKIFEDRLGVPVPYWDSVTDRHIPAALDDSALLTRWSVSRAWDPTQLADPADLNAVKSFPGTFTGFQTTFEGAVHGGTHNAVGGDTAGSLPLPIRCFGSIMHSSTRSGPLGRQVQMGRIPPNMTEVLKPANMQTGVPFGVSVSSLLNIATLGYSYA